MTEQLPLAGIFLLLTLLNIFAFSSSRLNKLTSPDQDTINQDGVWSLKETDSHTARITCYGTSFRASDFDFFSRCGKLGRKLIWVHQIPLSLMGEASRIDPLNDLVLICTNCHAVLHLKNLSFLSMSSRA
jgi:predicted HNH restriction endonuclease